MKPFPIRMFKSTISIALAALATQVSNVYGVTTSLYMDKQVGLQLSVFLTSAPTGFTAGVVANTGLMQGQFNSETWDFFCAELNQGIGFNKTYSNFEQSTIPLAGLHDGAPSPTALTALQKCHVEGVFKALGVYTAQGFINDPIAPTLTNTAQDLLGTSNALDKAALQALDAETITAAQLVIWEIIHEQGTGTDRGKVDLYGDDFQWKVAVWDDINFVYVQTDFTTTFEGKFNTIANTAYSFCPVPEITSPVALLAGGLLFVRRRERRGSRLKKPVVH